MRAKAFSVQRTSILRHTAAAASARCLTHRREIMGKTEKTDHIFLQMITTTTVTVSTIKGQAEEARVYDTTSLFYTSTALTSNFYVDMRHCFKKCNLV